MRNDHNDLFWILPGKLAGMSYPDQSKASMSGLCAAGVGAIVTLTLRPLQPDLIREWGFEYLHLPVHDFTAPGKDQVESFVRFCDRNIDSGRAVAVHCRAGIGRTGVMLACYLVHLGSKPHKAVRKVRRVRPGALETAEQEDAVYEFAASALS